ncbi:Inner membrane transport protein YajR [Clavibacter michiganensis subsp. michiganensis]|uniref:MFS transporter n=1 Tax=Clavibacter michiganensis TaxID=28447 RepID=UPI00130373E7|nr:MFS transporter [Clavibacter michiganensis]KAF0259809.1 Inner membrane transport protein YajR [Clavibacter michiganensis subsp. michiganensis]MBE3077426.1 MFS transporter [Clavibacter michiganensis subsp. michiganensis]
MSEDERGTRRADSPRNALVNISPLTDPNIEATQREAAGAFGGDPVVTGTSESNEPPRVGAGFVAVYSLTYFGFFLVLFVPSLFSLAYKVQLIEPEGKEAALGLIVGIGALFNLILGPIFGVLSDATRLRWGRRRPFLVFGLGVAALAACLIAIAPSVPLVLAGWIIAQVAASAISAALNPTLPERVPAEQRGKLGALSGVAASIAGVSATLVGSLLTGDLVLLFLLPVAVLAVGVVLWLFVVPDAPAPAGVQRPIGAALRSLLFDPRKHPDFAWVWIGKFCLQIGLAFFTTYQLYFLLDRLGFTAEEAGRQLAVVGGISLLATMLFTIAGGTLSDRLRRRKPFIYLASAMIAAGMITAAFSSDFVIYAVAGALLAAGTGAFNSVDLALASDVLPDKAESGKWMSIYHLSGALSTAVGPAIAPLVLSTGASGANYTLLFVSGGILALGSVITVIRVRGAR